MDPWTQEEPNDNSIMAVGVTEPVVCVSYEDAGYLQVRSENSAFITAARTDLPAALDDLELYQAFAKTVRTLADAVCVRAWGSQMGECAECMQRDLCEAEPLYKALAALGEGE